MSNITHVVSGLEMEQGWQSASRQSRAEISIGYADPMSRKSREYPPLSLLQKHSTPCIILQSQEEKCGKFRVGCRQRNLTQFTHFCQFFLCVLQKISMKRNEREGPPSCSA